MKAKVRHVADPGEGSEGPYLLGGVCDERLDAGDDVAGAGFLGCWLQHHAEQEDHTQRLSAPPHDPGAAHAT